MPGSRLSFGRHRAGSLARFASLAASLLLVASACGSSASSAAPTASPSAAPSTPASVEPTSAAPTPEPTAELRLGITPIGGAGPIGSTNPFSAWPWYPTILTWQTLVGYDENRQLIPEFAESWTSSPDGLTWTFKIAAGKVWSDGQPATARDVAFTYKYMLDTVGTDHEINVGFMSTDPMKVVESVTATDDQTVVMKLKEPSLYPIDNHQFIFPEHVLSKVDPKDLIGNYQFPLPLVGTGPFIATEAKQDQLLRMERNPHYAGPGPHVAAIVMSWIDNPEAAATALRNGEVDVVDGLPTSNLAGLATAPGVTVQSSASPWYWYLGFNTLGKAGGGTTDATADPAFRDAIGYALDRKTLVEKVLLGAGVVTDSPMVPFMSDFNTRIETDLGPAIRTFNLDEAKSRLDAAGYKLGADGKRLDKAGKPLELRLVVPSDAAQAVSSAQFITEWLGQLGISATALSIDSATLNDKYKPIKDGGGGWDLTVSSWWPEPEVRRVFETWSTPLIGVGNKAFYSSAAYDAELAKLSGTIDHDQLLTIASSLASILNKDAPILMLYDLNVNIGYRSDRFTGWVDQPAQGGRAFGNYYPERSWESVSPVAP